MVRNKNGVMVLNTVEHYAEIMADAFASALEDGYTSEEIRFAVWHILQSWGVNYE